MPWGKSSGTGSEGENSHATREQARQDSKGRRERPRYTMWRMRKAAVLSLIMATACQTVSMPAVVTVCEVNERPAKFANREVVLNAEVDLRSSRFVDARCPGQMIAGGGSAADGWAELRKRLTGSPTGRVFAGKFKGTIRVDGRDVSFEVHEVLDVYERTP